MRIYHTATQSDYDALMTELEENGYYWVSGNKPTSKYYWEFEKENTSIQISGIKITFGSIEQGKKKYPEIEIIKYKANKQGEK